MRGIVIAAGESFVKESLDIDQRRRVKSDSLPSVVSEGRVRYVGPRCTRRTIGEKVAHIGYTSEARERLIRTAVTGLNQ